MTMKKKPKKTPAPGWPPNSMADYAKKLESVLEEYKQDELAQDKCRQIEQAMLEASLYTTPAQSPCKEESTFPAPQDLISRLKGLGTPMPPKELN